MRERCLRDMCPRERWWPTECHPPAASLPALRAVRSPSCQVHVLVVTSSGCVSAELWGERLRRTDGPRSWGVSWEKPSKGDGPGDTACAGSRGSSPNAGHGGSSDPGHWQLIALTVQQGWPGPAPSPRALRTPTASMCLLSVVRAGT